MKSIKDHFVRMAAYNAWMNQRLYEASANLTAADLAAQRGAFFGSLLGTLNHLVVTDTMWLQRFATHPSAHRALDPVRALPAPTGLRQTMFTELAPLWAHRKMLDDTIVAWVDSLSLDDLEHVLVYANTRGVWSNKRFASLVAHFFNHQTHHRGQATTLLFQAGQDVGATDLLMLIPNENAEETPAS